MSISFETPQPRFGVVYPHDVIGPAANLGAERIEAEQHRSALAAVRMEAVEDIETHGLVEMADMRLALHRIVQMHEGLSHFVGDLKLEEVTTEYIGVVMNKVLTAEQGEISPEDCEEFFTGLSELVPELKRTSKETPAHANGTGMYL